jgi:DNA adenine methylase
MKIPQPIPYQGSKRGLAKAILSFFPKRFDTLIEPFSGSAAVSLAAAANKQATHFHINDSNRALMQLWEEIINNPHELADNYTLLWTKQGNREKDFYSEIRDKFNKEPRSDYFLYLLARCIKASVRYNSKGEFNQSPDNRRRGREPKSMRQDILISSRLLRNRTKITSLDYKVVLKNASENDLVYMDPPYQGVCTGKDPRYYETINFDEFIEQIEQLNARDVPFIISYDGRKGDKVYGKEIPGDLGVKRIEIDAGRSTQSTLLGRNENTYESLYLSKNIAELCGVKFNRIIGRNSQPNTRQMSISALGE